MPLSRLCIFSFLTRGEGGRYRAKKEGGKAEAVIECHTAHTATTAGRNKKREKDAFLAWLSDAIIIGEKLTGLKSHTWTHTTRFAKALQFKVQLFLQLLLSFFDWFSFLPVTKTCMESPALLSRLKIAPSVSLAEEGGERGKEGRAINLFPLPSLRPFFLHRCCTTKLHKIYSARLVKMPRNGDSLKSVFLC